MAYLIEKRFENGVTCSYLKIISYKYNAIRNELDVELGLFVSEEIRRNSGKFYQVDKVRIISPDLNCSKDILETIYNELNKLDKYKTYKKI